MEPWETEEYRGFTIELHQDIEPSPPSDWDNLGTMVAFDRLWREYRFCERVSTGDEDDAIERGGARLLLRYLRIAHGMLALPFQFQDYGSSGARILAGDETDDEFSVSGFIFTTHDRVNELCGLDKKFHTVEWITQALEGELKNWDAYVEGRVVGMVITDANGETVDSCWGFYPDHDTKPGDDGYDFVRAECREIVDAHIAWEAEQVEKINRAMAL